MHVFELWTKFRFLGAISVVIFVGFSFSQNLYKPHTVYATVILARTVEVVTRGQACHN